MSAAFRDQWMRMSATKRLLTMLTVLAKSRHLNDAEPLSFSIAELEGVITNDVLVQSIEGDKVIIRYSPPGTQMFVMQENQAAERSATSWTTPETGIPSRLADILPTEERPTRRPLVSTLNDAEMAAREAMGNLRTNTQRRAAEKRLEPLPITEQPTHPPS